MTSADLEIWRVDLDQAGMLLDRLGWVGDLARELAFDRRRRAAHVALRLLLTRHGGAGALSQPYELSPGGKPRLVQASIEFSLSHSDGVAVVALSRAGPVGIDVERVRPMLIADHRRARIEDAACRLAGGRWLEAVAPDPRLIEAWVRLEAVAKLTGEGMGRLLERCGVRARGVWAHAVEPYAIGSLDAGAGFVAAVAAAALPRDLTVKPFPSSLEDLEARFGHFVSKG